MKDYGKGKCIKRISENITISESGYTMKYYYRNQKSDFNEYIATKTKALDIFLNDSSKYEKYGSYCIGLELYNNDTEELIAEWKKVRK